MKTLNQILKECPKHDTAILQYNSFVYGIQHFVVDEIQIRWIQLCVARGEIRHDRVHIISNGRTVSCFREDGILTNPLEGNTMSLADDLKPLFLLMREDYYK